VQVRKTSRKVKDFKDIEKKKQRTVEWEAMAFVRVSLPTANQ
jgi:hypothetical protein